MDPNNNITEAREDNNEVTFHLTSDGYAELGALWRLPTSPAPERVEAEVRSTGTREAWHATERRDSRAGRRLGAIFAFTLASGGLTTPWDLTVPSTASGDEEGG